MNTRSKDEVIQWCLDENISFKYRCEYTPAGWFWLNDDGGVMAPLKLKSAEGEVLRYSEVIVVGRNS